jgi:hypothetical protein
VTPLRIAWGDVAKLQTLSDSTEAAGYPGANLQDIRLSRIWRSTSASAQWILFDAGVGKTITFDTCCIMAHNLTAAAVVKVQSDDASSWAPPGGVDRNGDPTQAIITIDVGLAQTPRRYVRVYIDDPTNPAGYVQLGRIMLCVRSEFETIDTGLQVSYEDTSLVDKSVTRQVYADIGIVSRIYTFSMGMMKNTTKQALLAMLVAVGQYDPVVVFPAESTVGATIGGSVEGINPIYATVSKVTTFTEAGGWGWSDDSLQFTEAH